MEESVCMMRIDKYLAEMGQGTRSEIKKLIRSGRVMVDGETVKKPEFKIDETTQKVSLEGKQIGYAKKEYYMLYKPAGVISATKDDRDKTVLDLITDKKRNDLFPVGRLDKDTEGLLLITNDGELAHRLLSPKKHVDKVYYAKVQGKVDESDVKAFADGVDIGDDTPVKSADLRILKSGQTGLFGNELIVNSLLFHVDGCLKDVQGFFATFLQAFLQAFLKSFFKSFL